MPYIKADGTVANGTVADTESSSPTSILRKVSLWFPGLSSAHKAVLVGSLALLCRQYLHSDPFAGGKIPAADLLPHQHWNRILNDDMFVRKMTAPLGKQPADKGSKKAWSIIRPNAPASTTFAS